MRYRSFLGKTFLCLSDCNINLFFYYYYFFVRLSNVGSWGKQGQICFVKGIVPVCNKLEQINIVIVWIIED